MQTDGHPHAPGVAALDLAAALAVHDVVPVPGAGAEQLQATAVRNGAHQAAWAAVSAEGRRGRPTPVTDGNAMANAVSWPSSPAPAGRVGSYQPLPVPPQPIAASPAGWDGEPNLHAPIGSGLI